MNMKHILLTLAIALSAPATAQIAGKDGSAASSAEARKPLVYCIQYERETGSRLARQQCRTKKQWAQQGVDVDLLTRK
jgi:hypothetical protein